MKFEEFITALRQASQSDRHAHAQKKLDFHLAEALPFDLFCNVHEVATQFELVFKMYILGVVTDKKDVRISAMDGLKDVCAKAAIRARQFKKDWNESKEEEEEEKKGKKNDCPTCE